MDEFKKGKKLHLLNGDTITVQSKIGEGGQGQYTLLITTEKSMH